MARPPSGSILVNELAQGRAFYLRFRFGGRRERVVLHERRGCGCGCGGGWDEPAARTELGDILARVRAGVYERPKPPPPLAPVGPSEEDPLFGDYAPAWLEAKIEGLYGSRPIGEGTRKDYSWRLRRHLIPFLGGYLVGEIDRDLCLAFKAHLLRSSRELREAIEAGARPRDEYGRREVPLGPNSIRKQLTALASILDDAVEDGHLDHNPARGRRLRIHVPRPRRTFLEMDELAALLDAAAELEEPYRHEDRGGVGPRTAEVAALLEQGLRPAQIAGRLGIARGSVSFHLRRLGVGAGRSPYIGRRVICEILGRGGVRVGELCNLKIGQVRLHDAAGARFHIPDSKTETGIRDVQMSPDLVEAVVEHLDRLRRSGVPTGPEDWLVPNTRGGRMTRQRAAKVVREAAESGSARLSARGLPPMPAITPHSLRRTYISIALLGNNFDVKWVMGQVGHADSKMTMDVYAQLEQRVDRSHGESFDRLVRAARKQTAGISPVVVPLGAEGPSGGARDPSVDNIPRLRRGSSVGRARD
jgi:integrase